MFFHSAQPKPIDCVRVDGAADEGPSHEVAPLVTKSSGSSYFNRVELQNGCLALGHSNTFIPSTLGGSCMDVATGKVNEEKHKKNLDLAIDAYIKRVDRSPCGDTFIRLYKGPLSHAYQLKCAKLTRFFEV